MKRTTTISFVAVLLIFWLAQSLWSQTDTLTVLHINDTHSHMVPYGPKDAQGWGTLGGIARAATLIGQVIATEENVLFLHAGDLFVDDFMFNKYFGVPELQIMAQLGCDAMTLGNHEFDLTPDVLKLALNGAGFPIQGFDILSANVDMSQDPVLAAFVKPYVIKDVGDLKVGIFGLTTEETNAFSNPAPDSITSFIQGALAAVDSLESQCDMIIALTHLGVAMDSILACNVPGIDVIVGGHSHTAIEEPVGVTNPLGKTTWIVQAGCFYGYVGYLKLACDSSGIEIIDYELMTVDNSVPEEPQIAATVQSLIEDLEADPRYGPVYTQMIAEADIDIGKEYGLVYKDTPLGNLITDAYRDTTKTDVALAAWGFISEKIYAGDLSGADIFRAAPYGYDEASGYGFKLMTFELSGLQLLLGLEYTIDQAKLTRDLLMQVSGMTFIYDSSKPLGVQISSLMIGGVLVNPVGTYSVTTNLGIFNLLSVAGLAPSNPQDPGVLEYEAIRDFIVENSPISYEVEGRIEDIKTPVEEVVSARLPLDYALFQNYPNPFNPTTTIEFAIPRNTDVILAVYNMIGQVVTILVDSELEAGHHRVVWDGSGMANGLYFYCLKAGDVMVTKRMVLMK